jgi:hypothetical protein
MNYIISSIILLGIVLLIIYILSINNNIDKFKNKLNEIFAVAKSNKINYLNDKDNLNLLNYIKYQFKNDDNVTIPTKIYYNKTDRGYEMNDINIICYKYNNTSFIESPYKINILFVPFEKEHYISNQSLLGLHGNYMITINNVNNIKNNKKVTIKEESENMETYTDILDMIPDIIHLSEDSEIDTTDTEKLISNNL